MKILAALTVLSLALVSDTHAAESKGIAIWGAGTASCGEFLRVTEENPGNLVAFGQWLHGYITGVNDSGPAGQDAAGGVDRAGLLAWTVKYCKDNPLDSYYTAAHMLVRELRAKPRAVPRGDL